MPRPRGGCGRIAVCSRRRLKWVALAWSVLVCVTQSRGPIVRWWSGTSSAPLDLVYIAGRPDVGGDDMLLKELELSVMSACSLTSTRLNFNLFISRKDFDECQASKSCTVRRVVETACKIGTGMAWLPIPAERNKFSLYPLDVSILDLFRTHMGVVAFKHHSTWYGYTKLWLPVLLPDLDRVIFVDTDTVFLQDPRLLDVTARFDPGQALGATQLVVPEGKHNLFRVRITSGVLVMDLGKMRAAGWEMLLRDTAVKNRKWEVDAPVTADFSIKGVCEHFHWGEWDGTPLCLLKPCSESSAPACDTGGSERLWEATRGDQDFFSYLLSEVKPGWLYTLPDSWQAILFEKDIDRIREKRSFYFTDCIVFHAPSVAGMLRFNDAELRLFPQVRPYIDASDQISRTQLDGP